MGRLGGAVRPDPNNNRRAIVDCAAGFSRDGDDARRRSKAGRRDLPSRPAPCGDTAPPLATRMHAGHGDGGA